MGKLTDWFIFGMGFFIGIYITRKNELINKRKIGFIQD